MKAMKALATVILTDIVKSKISDLKGDLYVFDSTMASALEENRHMIQSLFLYDVDPQRIVWCHEEALARKEDLKVRLMEEKWVRLGVNFFGSNLFCDFCGRVLMNYYYAFLRTVIKLKYLLEKYEQVRCVIDEETHSLNLRFFSALLPADLNIAYKKSVFDIRCSTVKKKGYSYVKGIEQSFVELRKMIKCEKWDREKDLIPCKYLVRIDIGTSPDRSYSILNSEHKDAMVFRDPTFIIDEKAISKKDTVFYFQTPIEDAETALREQGYNVVNQECFLTKLTVVQFRRMAAYFWIIAMLMRTKGLRLIHKEILDSFFAHIRTMTFAQHVACKAHISQMDIEPLSVIRAMTFRETGIRTAQYIDSTDFFHHQNIPTPLFFDAAFDHMFTIGNVDTKLFRLHTKNVRAFHEIGLVRMARKEVLIERAEQERAAILNRHIGDSLIITVFDTNVLCRDYEDTLPNWKEMWEYTNAVMHELVNSANLFFILKPKKNNQDTTSFFWGEKKSGLPFFKIYEDFKMKTNTKVLDYRVDSAYAILLSDIVISPMISTTGFEALALGKPSIFYDAAGKYVEHKFSKIPHLVAHSLEHLNALIEFWTSAGEDALEVVKTGLRNEIAFNIKDPIKMLSQVLINDGNKKYDMNLSFRRF